MTAVVRCIDCEDPREDICPASSPADCARVTLADGMPRCPFAFDTLACDVATVAEVADSRAADARLERDDATIDDESGWDK